MGDTALSCRTIVIRLYMEILTPNRDTRPGELYEVTRNLIRCTEPDQDCFGRFMKTTFVKRIRSNDYNPHTPTSLRVLDKMNESVSRIVNSKSPLFLIIEHKKSINLLKKKKRQVFLTKHDLSFDYTLEFDHTF